MIESNRTLAIAGAPELLEQCPSGSWIAATTAYFMTDTGGRHSNGLLYVDELPFDSKDVTLRRVTVTDIPQIPELIPDHGLALIAIPAFSDFHQRFGQLAPNLPKIFDRPIAGWIAGFDLGREPHITPRVHAGNKSPILEGAALMTIQLPPALDAIVDIVNLFKPGDGPTLSFSQDGFSHSEVLVDGRPERFAAWLRREKVDSRLPLVVSDLGGAVNVSLKTIPEDDGTVELYAPVFRGLSYRIAEPVADYASAFRAASQLDSRRIVFACNCILNYLYSNLEGVRLPVTGPITFGEVAYQLLNQTLVTLELVDRA